MNHNSLAVKYRPNNFEDVVGQSSSIQILLNHITTGSIKHAYLFSGPAGCGKTTVARILAQMVNKGEGDPEEIDAASNNGVDNVRSIISRARMCAVGSEYRVFIFDECHALSNSAWQAMLKIVEEPPIKTIFIFCTTDPQKVPATILSRVQRFDFKRMTIAQIVGRLKYILSCEGISIYEEKALEYVSKMADGGMRAAISLLEKCLGYSDNITIANVVAALGIANYGTMFDLTNAIIDYRSHDVIRIIDDLYTSGIDIKQFVKQYWMFTLDLCKYCKLSNFDYIGIPESFRDEMEYVCREGAFLIQFLKKLTEINSLIKYEPNAKQAAEMHFLLLSIKEQ